MLEHPNSPAAAPIRLCYRHSDTPATRGCDVCRRPICVACAGVGPKLESICAPCADAGRTRTQRLTASAVLVVVVALGGLAGWVFTRPPAVTYGEHAGEIERAAARVANAPCDGQSTLDLITLLNQERDFRRTIDLVDTFDASCAPVPRLWWSSYAARTEVQDFAGAERDATRLIDDDKEDADFRWWRGKSRRSQGNLAGAAEDFQKAIELSPNAFFSVLDYADVVERQGKACAAIPALVKLVHNQPDDAAKQRVPQLLHRLITDTPCPDPTAALPRNTENVATVCTTLPAGLDFEGDVTSGFAFSVQNTWTARTAPVATGPRVRCAVDVAEVDTKGGILAGTGMRSWSGRLACTGKPSITAQALHAVPLQAQEELVKKLVDAGIRRFCDGA